MKIKIRQATKQGYIEMENGTVADLSYPSSKMRRGRVQGGGYISPTLTCSDSTIYVIGKEKSMLHEGYEIRIRKLTPKECWRLMGFSDEDFEKAKQTNSDSQLFKQAGNSIVVPVLENIFKQLF